MKLIKGLLILAISSLILIGCNEKKEIESDDHKGHNHAAGEVHKEDSSKSHDEATHEKEVAHAVHKHQSVCPVTGEDLDGKYFVKKGDKTIYVANEACKKEVEKDFDKYAKELEYEGYHLGSH